MECQPVIQNPGLCYDSPEWKVSKCCAGVPGTSYSGNPSEMISGSQSAAGSLLPGGFGGLVATICLACVAKKFLSGGSK